MKLNTYKRILEDIFSTFPVSQKDQLTKYVKEKKSVMLEYLVEVKKVICKIRSRYLKQNIPIPRSFLTTSSDGYEFVCLDCKNIKQVEKQRCSICYKTKEVINFKKFRLGYNKFCNECEIIHKDSIEIEDEDLKHCTLCKENKILDKFSKSKTDGYSQYCSECSKNKSKEYRINHKSKGVTVIKDQKKCSMCKVEKDINSFYININSKDGKTSKCIDCDKKYDKELRLSKVT